MARKLSKKCDDLVRDMGAIAILLGQSVDDILVRGTDNIAWDLATIEDRARRVLHNVNRLRVLCKIPKPDIERA